MEESSDRISSGGRKALCGVELSRPNAAWTPARASFGARSGRMARSCLTHTSTYLRCVSRDLLPCLEGQRRPVPILYDDQRLVVEGERDVPVDERRQRLLRRVRRPRPLSPDAEELVADADEHFGEHGVLGAEVAVERGAGEPTGRSQLGDGDAVEALLGEQLGRDGQDLLTS